MPYYRSIGNVPRKRHTQFLKPEGGYYSEELMGREGFSNESALIYHVYPPTQVLEATTWDINESAGVLNLPLSPRHFKTHKLDGGNLDAVTGRHLLLSNSDIHISYCVARTTSPLYRNATGDECIFVETGQGIVETTFGSLEVRPGDYVIIPMSTTHRWIPTSEQLKLLIVESKGHIDIPKRYRSPTGQLLEGAPFSERDLRGPEEPLLSNDTEVEVFVRHKGGGTRFRYAHHPFDVVGWDGCLYPYAFNIADFEPKVGRIHLPPPVHQTFEGQNFVICSFCPRPLDFDTEAVPVPYNHANVDSDEVLFYVAGDFMSRGSAGIEPGSISLHPAGFIHGPQPGVVESSIGSSRTEELAVMIDTFHPLELESSALSCEDPNYRSSWLPNKIAKTS